MEPDYDRTRTAIRLAREEVRRCENELDRQLAATSALRIREVARAERWLAQARVRLRELERSARTLQ